MKIETKGMFKNWDMTDYHTISDEDGNYCLWVCNGFWFFDDYNSMWDKKEPFIIALSFWQKYRVWREYRREMKTRVIHNINKQTDDKKTEAKEEMAESKEHSEE